MLPLVQPYSCKSKVSFSLMWYINHLISNPYHKQSHSLAISTKSSAGTKRVLSVNKQVYSVIYSLFVNLSWRLVKIVYMTHM